MATLQPYIEVPLTVDGKRKYIKGVTRYTTCGDILKMVLQKRVVSSDNDKMMSYGLFESSRGIERLLPGKSRISKVMRTWGSSNDYQLILRKVNPVMSLPKVSEAKRRKLSKLSSKRVESTDENKENNSKWNFDGSSVNLNKGFVQFHDTMKSETQGCVQEIYFSDSDNTMHKLTSSKDDEYESILGDKLGKTKPYRTQNNLYKQDVNAAAFQHKPRNCSLKQAAVTRVSLKSDDINISRNITGRSESLSELVDSQNVTPLSHTKEVKFAIRKTLKSKQSSTSTRTTRSKSKPRTSVGLSGHEDTFHSTPCHVTRSIAKCTRTSTVKHKILAQTIREQISQMNQKEGKEAILQKYFSDYLLYRSPSSVVISTKYRGRGDGADSQGEEDITNHSLRHGSRHADGTDSPNDSSNISNTQNSQIRNYGHHHDDEIYDVTSDSGQEDGDFDNAFIDEGLESETPCFRKLVDYSITESDISELSAIHNDDSNEISRSTLSSISDIVKSAFSENVELNEDDVMASFMDSKVSDENSDEGLSSLGSEDDREKEFVV